MSIFLEPDPNLEKEYNLAEARGASREELKQIYMRMCSYGMPLDTKIYRVFKIQNLIDDYSNDKFTFPSISSKTWGANSGENPLQTKKYMIEGGSLCSINTGDYFGSCWSTSDDAARSFRDFSASQDSIRVSSTIDKILSSLINTNDKFFDLHYHVSSIFYEDRERIAKIIDETPIEAYIDPSGRKLARTLFLLPNDFSEEQEIRFVYLYQPQNCEWVKKNVEFDIINNMNFCRHPFNWQNVIDEVVYDQRLSQLQINDQKNKIKDLGIFK